MRNIICNLRAAVIAAAVSLAGLNATADTFHLSDRTIYMAPKAHISPQTDGIANEDVWGSAKWQLINNLWLGSAQTKEDFQGRFKAVWTEEKLYILTEIVDDVLYDGHRDPLLQYWDDDCLEIFIDEDFSGGDHQYNHNAFAYHLSLDNQAVDIGTDHAARNYSHHVDSRWKQNGNRITWEVAISIYDDSYEDDSADNSPVKLFTGKQMGLMLAYCDNDGEELRENFVGSESVPNGPKDRGWIDAGIFGSLILAEAG